MEQSYLDNYTLDYNVNRVASSVYEPSQASVNIGADNPSYKDISGEQAFVWVTYSSGLRHQHVKLSINRCFVVGNGSVVRGFKSSAISYLNDTSYKPDKINLNADKDKKDIIKENKNKSGVYCWTNKKKMVINTLEVVLI